MPGPIAPFPGLSPATPPLRVRVASHADIRAALMAAAEQARPAELWSLRGAARWLGPRWLRLAIATVAADLAASATTAPAPTIIGVLDCGNAPGLALAAWTDGQTAVALSAPNPPPHSPAWTRLSDIAAHGGYCLLRSEDGPPDPPILPPHDREGN